MNVIMVCRIKVNFHHELIRQFELTQQFASLVNFSNNLTSNIKNLSKISQKKDATLMETHGLENQTTCR